MSHALNMRVMKTTTTQAAARSQPISLTNKFIFCGPHRASLNLSSRIHAAAPVQEKESRTQTQKQQNETSYEEATTKSTPKSAGRVVLESEDELKSTWQHRLYVGTTTTLLASTFAVGISNIHTSSDAVWGIGALFAAYILSDLGTAFYHWGVDNYGDANTPIFGGQIAAFQGHHQRPWTITEREFCNNVHKVFAPAAPFSAVLFALSFFTPSSWAIWSSSFLFLACMSQQFHAWSHMKASELHPAIVAAQDAGLLISRKAHGAHHKSPFNGNYSIVSGLWNPILDGESPELSVYKKLEDFILEKYGVEPRGWYEPQEGWEELIR